MKYVLLIRVACLSFELAIGIYEIPQMKLDTELKHKICITYTAQDLQRTRGGGGEQAKLSCASPWH